MQSRDSNPAPATEPLPLWVFHGLGKQEAKALRTQKRPLTQFRWYGGTVKEGFLEEEAVKLDFDNLKEMGNGCFTVCSFHTHEQGLWAEGTQRCVRPTWPSASAVVKQD